MNINTKYGFVLDEMENIASSGSGLQTDWKGTSILHELNISTIMTIKQKPGKDIPGSSPSAVDQLILMDMIDEFLFLV